jgi:hypothetical protein
MKYCEYPSCHVSLLSQHVVEIELSTAVSIQCRHLQEPARRQVRATLHVRSATPKLHENNETQRDNVSNLHFHVERGCPYQPGTCLCYSKGCSRVTVPCQCVNEQWGLTTRSLDSNLKRTCILIGTTRLRTLSSRTPNCYIRIPLSNLTQTNSHELSHPIMRSPAPCPQPQR